MSALSAVRAAILPPRFRCRECRQVCTKTIFDFAEADGSYVCSPCERTMRSWHADANQHLYGTGAFDRG
jgi:hypothetical protein